ncbi:MAG: DUF2752 domain-containing protein [Chitinophagales bacterium]
MVTLPIVLFLLPKTFFDQGPTLCIFTLITGINCPGCGTTRACMRLIHFDFQGAWDYNKMSFLLFPALAFLYARFFVLNFKRLIQQHKT